MAGVAEAIDDEQQPPHFDLCCALLSLPRIFKTRPDSIPSDIPYIHAAGNKVARWREKIAGDTAALRVGLVWASHSRNAKFAVRKSVQLAGFAPLARVPRVALYSLQKGAAAAQARRPPEGMTLFDWTDDILDFSDTAALVANLDLVISVDTSVAHLAGAMGKPVWTLAPFPTDWRWVAEGTNPWYPTMRIFRQRRLQGWADVVQQVADALTEAASCAGARVVDHGSTA